MKYNPAFLDDETLVRTFVVRHRELATVMESVRENTDDANQHVLVIGPRGSGKSTLVLRVAAEVRRDGGLRELWYPVVYGEESYLVTSAGEFWLEALLQIAEQTGEDRWRQAHQDLLSEPESDRLARRALAQLMDFADERGVRLLFVVENLHQLVGSQIADNDEMWAIRRTLQTEPRIMLLGTATRRFDQIDDRGQALYEFFRILDLRPLDSLDEIGDLWELAGNADKPRAFLRPVEILTGGNPRLIRILSEFAAKTSFGDLMENLVHLMDEHTEYFKHHLDRLAPTERKVFVALADRWDPGTARDVAEVARMDTSAVSALLKRLEERDAVRVVGQRGRAKVYQVAERLYNVYHLMRRRGQASARVKAAVRFMVYLYQGDALVPAVRSLVSEARALPPDLRRDHYIAYAELLDLVPLSVRVQILLDTREEVLSFDDVPDLIRGRIARGNEYDGWLLDDLLTLDLPSLTAKEILDYLKTMIFQSDPERRVEIHSRVSESSDLAVRLNPESEKAYFDRGVALIMLDRYDEALSAFDRAANIDPGLSAMVHFNRGTVYNLLDRREEALNAFRQAADLSNSIVTAPAFYSQGTTLARLGRHRDALAAYEQATDLNSSYTEAYYNRGFSLAVLKRYNEALSAFDQAIQLNSESVEAHRNRGVVLFHLGRYDEALAAYDRALDLYPDDAVIEMNRGEALSELGKTDEALVALDRSLRLPNAATSLDDLIDLVLSLAARSEPDRALDVLSRSPIANDVEPLLVALRQDLGEDVTVAQEINEVAKDLLLRIAERRAARA